MVAIATQGEQHTLTDGHGISAHCHGLGHIGPGADTAGDDKLHLADNAHVFQGLDRLTQSGQRRDAGVFDEDLLRGRRAALHAVEHDHVGAGLDGQLDVVEDARSADLT